MIMLETIMYIPISYNISTYIHTYPGICDKKNGIKGINTLLFNVVILTI